MAVTQLSDAIIPEVYLSYQAVDGPELTAFYESGVLVRNEAINAAIQAGGTMPTLPFWKDLDPTVEPNYSTDDPADVAVPNKIAAGEMVCRTADMNQAYSTMDLVAELAGSDPMQRIRNRFGAYWGRQLQRRLLATCTGIYADNLANDNGDMILNIAEAADVTKITVDNLFSRKAFTGALFTLGDHFGTIGTIAVHSIVYKQMYDNDEIVMMLPSQPDPNLPLESQQYPTFCGKRIVIDDSMPVAATADNKGYQFTSILFGAAAIGSAERPALNPVETLREPLKGNGSGMETIIERKCYVIHPFGYKWLNAQVTGKSPSLANLKDARNWDRVIDRKQVPIAFLVTNG